ncbi:MAG: hypothetical protein ACREA4_09045, partial [Nitrososphaera sp.]
WDGEKICSRKCKARYGLQKEGHDLAHPGFFGNVSDCKKSCGRIDRQQDKLVYVDAKMDHRSNSKLGVR